MKGAILLAAVAMMAAVGANAQTKPAAPEIRTKGFILDMWTQYGYGKQFQPIELMIAPGWAFNRTLFGRAQIAAETALWNVGGAKTWTENVTFGPALGANVWRSKRTDDRLAVVGAAGWALAKQDTWAYNFYDLGLELSDRHALVGAGVRYYDSRARSDDWAASITGNRATFYIKIGWTLGK